MYAAIWFYYKPCICSDFYYLKKQTIKFNIITVFFIWFLAGLKFTVEHYFFLLEQNIFFSYVDNTSMQILFIFLFCECVCIVQ